MMTAKRVSIIDESAIDQVAETQRLVDGLRATHASIEPKYFYDELGCALYAAICHVDEYYPTRVERAIFQRFRQEIADCTGRGGTLVDLGAGDCAKAKAWLPFMAPARYLAVDIADAPLQLALVKLAAEFPEIEMTGLVTDFSRSLRIAPQLLQGQTTLFYPGSSIGNFTPQEATRFLREMFALTAPGGGGLLIGVDAKKDAARLTAAYDDALGVTAAFNLNVLRHVNRLLGGNFDLSAWRHVGLYNEAEGRVEMHLESRRDQEVMLNGENRLFLRGEKIHSENAYKYHRHEFAALLTAAGFGDIRCWSDSGESFWVFYAR